MKEKLNQKNVKENFYKVFFPDNFYWKKTYIFIQNLEEK